MNSKLRPLLLCALFAALTAVCSQIQIPLPIIPINLALFAVYLTGALLGAGYGSLSMLCYLLLGAAGAPIFAGMQGGFGVLVGKTGGYLIGYILAAAITGGLAKVWGRSFFKLCLAMALGLIVCYTFGTVWFMFISGNRLWQSLVYCVFPFLPGDIVKIVLAALLSSRLYPQLHRFGWGQG